ncbi:hypothetical protein ACFFJN_05985 [Erwinia mallotivora]|uniref:hypothetical protein n=1 Tax=Erwinia mallotivora TaxID=69222 RepID=UPI0035E8A973
MAGSRRPGIIDAQKKAPGVTPVLFFTAKVRTSEFLPLLFASLRRQKLSGTSYLLKAKAFNRGAVSFVKALCTPGQIAVLKGFAMQAAFVLRGNRVLMLAILNTGFGLGMFEELRRKVYSSWCLKDFGHYSVQTWHCPTLSPE